MKKVEEDGNLFIFECPHCDGVVVVDKRETACCIFRHAVYKTNGEQVNPHLNKKACDELKEKDLVFGCAKPFRFVYGNENIVEICEYI